MILGLGGAGRCWAVLGARRRWAALGCAGRRWAVLGAAGVRCAVLGAGRDWAVLNSDGRGWAVLGDAGRRCSGRLSTGSRRPLRKFREAGILTVRMCTLRATLGTFWADFQQMLRA